MTTDVEAIVQTPAAEIQRALRSDDWSDRLWNFGSYKPGFQPFVDFGLLNPSYSQNFWHTDGHTYNLFARQHGFAGNVAYGHPVKMTIPANAQPGTGTDGQLTGEHVDANGQPTGEYENGWAYSSPKTPGASNPWSPLPQWHADGSPGFSEGRDAVAAGYEHCYPNEKGNATTMSPAVPLHIGIARPFEVAAGKIGHALAMTISRNCGMGGVVAPGSIIDAEDPLVGVTLKSGLIKSYRAACSPARLLTPSAPTVPEHTIPEGMRFAITITDTEIETWLDSRRYTGALRNTARIFAVAMRDFGCILTAFGGTAAILADGANAKTAWAPMGLTSNVDLLHGLITRPRLYALRPAQSRRRSDGAIVNRECDATECGYGLAA